MQKYERYISMGCIKTKKEYSMYKKLLTVLATATLACGFTFAEETEAQKPATEQPQQEEQTQEQNLAGCPCQDKKQDEQKQDQTDETLAGCSCKDKKKNQPQPPKVACSKCGDKNHHLAVDDSNATDDNVEEETEENTTLV